MKILCPTDFSEASTNACLAAAKLINPFEDKQIHLVHCINIVSRAGMFLKMEDMLRQQAKEDLNKLKESIEIINPEIKVTSTVVLENPKSYTTKLAEKEGFDLISIGTEGLSALKDVTIGSVTEYIIRKSNIPVLAIPPQSNLDSISSIAMGIENDVSIHRNSLTFLESIADFNNAKIIGINVRSAGQMASSFKMETLFPTLETEFHSIEVENNIPSTMANFVSNNDISILVMIHQKKNWLQRLFYNSITKAELFEINFPLLVLPG